MSDPYGQYPLDPGPGQWRPNPGPAAPQYGSPAGQPAPGQWPRDPHPTQWPQYGGPALPPVPPPESKRRRVHPAVWIVAGVVVVAVVAGLLVALLAKGEVHDAPNTGGRELAVPRTIPGFTAVRGVNTDDLKASLGDDIAQKGDDPEAVVEHAAVGVFQRTGSSARVVFVGISLRDIPSFRGQVQEDGVESTLKFFMSGVASGAGAGGTRPQSFPPGPRGGFQLCTTGETSGTPVTICSWGDESAFALTIITGSTPLATAAEVTRSLRGAIESG